MTDSAINIGVAVLFLIGYAWRAGDHTALDKTRPGQLTLSCVAVGILAFAVFLGRTLMYGFGTRVIDEPPMSLTSGEVERLMTETHILDTAEVDIAYDVRGPLPPADGRPPLLMIGQPMDASGFVALASHFPDRTVVTYDPRGLAERPQGRPSRPNAHGPGSGRACRDRGARRRAGELFASSGGAVTALARSRPTPTT